VIYEAVFAAGIIWVLQIWSGLLDTCVMILSLSRDKQFKIKEIQVLADIENS